jgi:hypothetical protein
MSAKKASTKKKSTTAKASGRLGSKAERTAKKKKKKSAGKTKRPGKEGKSRKKAKKKNPKSLTAEAVGVVAQAASILEEEISAGIIAAKKVEERYLNVGSLRSGESEKIMQRFRKDAHEVLDIVLDLINLSINSVSGLSERAINIRSTAVPRGNDKGKPDDTLSELVVPEILKPGESGKVGMLVENENEDATGEFEFTSSGLLSSTGNQLDAQNISFDPASLEIGAYDLEKVMVTVSVPEGTPPGQYSGLVRASLIQMRVLLTVQVEA